MKTVKLQLTEDEVDILEEALEEFIESQRYACRKYGHVTELKDILTRRIRHANCILNQIPKGDK